MATAYPYKHTMLEKDAFDYLSNGSLVAMCDVCLYMDESNVAIGYCVHCDEKLCIACLKVHKSSKGSREHRILSIDEKQNPSLFEKDKPDKKANKDMNMKNNRKLNCDKKADDTLVMKRQYVVHRLDHNRQNSFITGMTVIDQNRLALADFKNHEVKIVDLAKDTTESLAILYETPPYDVACMENDTVVAACGYKIFFFSTKADSKSFPGKISFTDKYYCTGVTSHDSDKLIFIASRPIPFILFTNKSGIIIYKIYLGSDESHLSYPHAVDVESDGRFMYVTDVTGNCVVKVATKRGGEKRVEKLVDCPAPTGIAIDGNGKVYVITEKCIHRYTISSEHKVLLEPTVIPITDGSPNALVYYGNHLFVSCGSNVINVYSINNEAVT